LIENGGMLHFDPRYQYFIGVDNLTRIRRLVSQHNEVGKRLIYAWIFLLGICLNNWNLYLGSFVWRRIGDWY
jgi:hypothetical protein